VHQSTPDADADALAKARQLSALLDVEVGELLFAVENLNATYPPAYRESDTAQGGSTPIRPGQLVARASVQTALAADERQAGATVSFRRWPVCPFAAQVILVTSCLHHGAAQTFHSPLTAYR
jgi:hypothetical protein